MSCRTRRRSVAPVALVAALLLAPEAFAQVPATRTSLGIPSGATPLAPTSRIDDTNYLGATLPGPGALLASEDPLTPTRIRSILPPRSVLSLSAGFLTNGEFTTLRPRVSFSNIPSGFDISVSPYLVGLTGLSVDLREDLSPVRRDLVRRLGTLYKRHQKHQKRHRKAVENGTKLSNQEVERIYSDALEGYIGAFNRAATRPRVAVTAGYGELEDIGATVRGGIVVSQLFELERGEDSSPGIIGSVHLEGVSFNPYLDESRSDMDSSNFVRTGQTRLRSRLDEPRAGLRTTLRVAWQNRVQKLCVGKSGRPLDIDSVRWRWQVGVEYSPKDRIVRDDTCALFVRYRIEPDANEKLISRRKFYARSTEFGLSLGWLPDNDPFVSFTVTKALGF